MPAPKNVIGVYAHVSSHWVGDGFPVRSMFPHDQLGVLSPFLMLDYAGPKRFEPSTKPRGVGEHPHRGFETVTIAYQGSVEHRDSGGSAGRIEPGDVQWMTAASGVVHEEMHSADFTREGGTFEMVQLWVNLPAAHKMSPPRYQAITSDQIARVDLAPGAHGRVIAGTLNGVRGPAKTFTPVTVVDLRLDAGSTADITLTEGHSAAVVLLHGHVVVNGATAHDEAKLVLLTHAGAQVHLEAKTDTVALLLSGEPIIEPIAWHGPFVMNTEAELRQAFQDYSAGRMGRLAPAKH